MPTPPISQEEAEKRITAVEQKLTEGCPPPGVTPPVGLKGAVRAAAVEDGATGGAAVNWLRAAIRVTGRNPDWSLYRERPKPSPSIDVPDGYRLKGTSTLVDMQTGEPKLEWVKTEADKERQKELALEWIAGLNSKIKRATPVKKPKHLNSDLLACYPISDYHTGMLAWGEETQGGDFDLAIAEDLLKGAIGYLVDAAPPAEQALIAVLGDFFHYDGFIPVTPKNRNELDADGRAPKMIRTGVRLLRYIIDRAREKHGAVEVIPIMGNHDPISIIWVSETLAALYENEPRVTVDTSPAMFKYFRFHKNLIGLHHGHGAKLTDLPGIMAADQPYWWGQTEHRVWWTGHKHSKEVLKARDFSACEVEQFRVIIPQDAWASGAGYRSIQSMHAIIRHKEHGETSRLTVNPKMLQ